MLNIQTTDNKTQAGSQHDETNAGQLDGAGHASRKSDFCSVMVCTERRAKQESVNPGLTQKEQLCLNVSSSSRKPDFSVTHEDSWREQLGWRARKSELVDLGNKLFWEVSRFIIVGLPLLLDHRNLKAWQRRWVSSLITKFDAGFRLYKAVTLQKRWISLISLPADPAIQCHSCLY